MPKVKCEFKTLIRKMYECSPARKMEHARFCDIGTYRSKCFSSGNYNRLLFKRNVRTHFVRAPNSALVGDRQLSALVAQYTNVTFQIKHKSCIKNLILEVVPLYSKCCQPYIAQPILRIS